MDDEKKVKGEENKGRAELVPEEKKKGKAEEAKLTKADSEKQKGKEGNQAEAPGAQEKSEAREPKKETPVETPKKELVQKRERVRISRRKWDETKEKVGKADEYYDQLLRLKAEFENYRKRMNREKEEFAKFAAEGLVTELLVIIDNLDNALSASEKTEDFKALHEGVEMTRKEALRILKQWGLEEVKAVGERFDPEKHEAVVHVDSGEEDGEVLEELRKGYSLKGKLLRPSMVKVARRVQDGQSDRN